MVVWVSQEDTNLGTVDAAAAANLDTVDAAAAATETAPIETQLRRLLSRRIGVSPPPTALAAARHCFFFPSDTASFFRPTLLLFSARHCFLEPTQT